MSGKDCGCGCKGKNAKTTCAPAKTGRARKNPSRIDVVSARGEGPVFKMLQWATANGAVIPLDIVMGLPLVANRFPGLEVTADISGSSPRLSIELSSRTRSEELVQELRHLRFGEIFANRFVQGVGR